MAARQDGAVRRKIQVRRSPGHRVAYSLSVNIAELNDFAARYTTAWCGGCPENVAAFFSPSGSLTINSGVPAV